MGKRIYKTKGFTKAWSGILRRSSIMESLWKEKNMVWVYRYSLVILMYASGKENFIMDKKADIFL